MRMALRKFLDSDLDRERAFLDRPEVMVEVLPPETEEDHSNLPSELSPATLPPLCLTVLEEDWHLEVLAVTLALTLIRRSSLATLASKPLAFRFIESMLDSDTYSLAWDEDFRCAL